MEDALKKQLKTQYRRIVTLDIGGRELAFRPMTRDALSNMQAQTQKSPEQRVKLSINAVESCCVHGREHFAEVADAYPLALVGTGDGDSILEALMTLARGNAQIVIED